MNKSAQRVGTDHTEQPQNKQDYKDCPKHAYFPLLKLEVTVFPGSVKSPPIVSSQQHSVIDRQAISSTALRFRSRLPSHSARPSPTFAPRPSGTATSPNPRVPACHSSSRRKCAAHRAPCGPSGWPCSYLQCRHPDSTGLLWPGSPDRLAG